METMKMIDVCAGVVFRAGLLMLASRRPGAAYSGLWEFPGGKVEPGETLDACISRELWEELGIRVSVCGELFSIVHRNGEKAVRLHFMRCEAQEPCQPRGLEGQQVDWKTAASLAAVSWVPADREAWQWLSQPGPLAVVPEWTVVNRDATELFRSWLREF